MREESKGIWISIIIWSLLMIMGISHFLEAGIIRIIGDYLVVFFLVLITALLWLGIYSMYKEHKKNEDFD